MARSLHALTVRLRTPSPVGDRRSARKLHLVGRTLLKGIRDEAQSLDYLLHSKG